MNNEELQSRREFFKKAAKGALPILGAIALVNAPQVMVAYPSTTCSEGCHHGCKGTCLSGCKSECSGGCKSSCLVACEGKTWTSKGSINGCDTCMSACWGCSNGCYGSCSGNCKGGAKAPN